MACKKPEGFFEGLYMMQRCIQLCRQVRTVMENLIRTRLWVWQLGMGHTSNYDRTRLGAMLWAEGAFKDD